MIDEVRVKFYDSVDTFIDLENTKCNQSAETYRSDSFANYGQMLKVRLHYFVHDFYEEFCFIIARH